MDSVLGPSRRNNYKSHSVHDQRFLLSHTNTQDNDCSSPEASVYVLPAHNKIRSFTGGMLLHIVHSSGSKHRLVSSARSY